MKISRHRKSRQATGGPGNGTRNQETQEQILTAHEGKGGEDTRNSHRRDRRGRGEGGGDGSSQRRGLTARPSHPP